MTLIFLYSRSRSLMRRMTFPLCHAAVFLALLIPVCFSPQTVYSQAEADDEEAEVIEAPAELGVARITDLELEIRVFGDLVRFKRASFLDVILKAQVEQTCAAYHFKVEYKQKLLLAGRVDNLRFFERLEQLKAQSCNRNLNPRQFVEFDTAAGLLRRAYLGFPFRHGQSLYGKTLNRLLKTERLAMIPVPFVDNAAEVYRIEEYWLSLGDFIRIELAAEAPLRDNQQAGQISDMLRKQMLDERRISLGNPTTALRKLGELPETAWKSVLDQSQWDCLKKKFKGARG
ncbi:MAG: hypothetical protein JWM11_161 [Planctomycetaceae bacterium]|nr:hypothetical protein [Planctomycetaceae bacterium]